MARTWLKFIKKQKINIENMFKGQQKIVKHFEIYSQKMNFFFKCCFIK